MVIKYTNIYHSKALQNVPKFWIFGLKTNHLATLFSMFQLFAKPILNHRQINLFSSFFNIHYKTCDFAHLPRVLETVVYVLRWKNAMTRLQSFEPTKLMLSLKPSRQLFRLVNWGFTVQEYTNQLRMQMKSHKLCIEIFSPPFLFFWKLPLYILSGFDRTTHSYSLLGSRRERCH
jgi:hypothetical protein